MQYDIVHLREFLAFLGYISRILDESIHSTLMTCPSYQHQLFFCSSVSESSGDATRGQRQPLTCKHFLRPGDDDRADALVRVDQAQGLFRFSKERRVERFWAVERYERDVSMSRQRRRW
jgi:hypothetical protein